MLADFVWPAPPAGMMWGRKAYLEYAGTVLVRPLYQNGEDGSQPLPCARLNVTSVMGDYRLHVESLKYYDRERGCLVTGRKILRWIIASFSSRVFVIDLTDAATATIASVTVDLTRFRKICKGKGWYESFGFHPISDEEDGKYQTSFAAIRDAPADLILSLILVFYFVLTKTGIGRDSNACMADVIKASSYSPDRKMRVPMETRQRILKVKEGLAKGEKKTLEHSLRNFLTVHGVSREMVAPMQPYLLHPVRERRRSSAGRRYGALAPPFFEGSPFPTRIKSSKTFAALAAPQGIQTLVGEVSQRGDYEAGSDLSDYISGLEAALELLEQVRYLYVPEKLVRLTS